jgi:hypothetical protein
VVASFAATHQEVELAERQLCQYNRREVGLQLIGLGDSVDQT